MKEGETRWKKNLSTYRGQVSPGLECVFKPALVQPQLQDGGGMAYKSWDTFRQVWTEWLSLGLGARSNDVFLASFKFEDKGIEFSHRAGVQAFMWANVPGL
jgi:hypothetical protein